MGSYFNQIPIDNISDSLLNRLYDIHYQIYQRKNTGVSKEVWKSNLRKDYHHLSQKQLFTYSKLGIDSLIDGYFIIAGIQMIENKPWVKILEGAASPNGSYITPVTAFAEMFNHLLQFAKEMKWNLWGEISLFHLGIFKLMVSYGFSPVGKLEIADSLYHSFLGERSEFNVHFEADKVKVRRPTRISNDYSGLLIGFEQNRNTNRIKQNQQHEYNR